MAYKRHLRILVWCVQCRKRRKMRELRIRKETTKRGWCDVAIGSCKCGALLRRILACLVIAFFLGGCAGLYIEKHLSIEGKDLVVPYGFTSIKGKNIKITRDVYIGWGNTTVNEEAIKK